MQMLIFRTLLTGPVRSGDISVAIPKCGCCRPQVLNLITGKLQIIYPT